MARNLENCEENEPGRNEPLFGCYPLTDQKYWKDIMDLMFVAGFITWKVTDDFKGRPVSGLTPSGHALAQWREEQPFDPPLTLYPGRLNYANGASAEPTTDTVVAVKGVTVARKGAHAGRPKIKHRGQRVPVSAECDTAAANEIKRLVSVYSAEELIRAKQCMPRSRPKWLAADYIAFYIKHAPVAARAEPVAAPVVTRKREEQVPLERDEDVHQEAGEHDEPLPAPVAKMAPGYDMCVRCEVSIEQDAPGDHCTDGQYMCNKCVHKAEPHAGDFLGGE
jgi:hypothetical protein